jgi:ABC-2 type transport system ATP-binding protein
MEQVCDDVTIINRGDLVETGSLDYIRSFAGEDRVVVSIERREEAIEVLASSGVAAHPRPDEQEISVDIDAGQSSDVTRLLAEAGLYLSGLRSEHPTLEHAFLNLTGDAPPPPLVELPAEPGAGPPPGPPVQPVPPRPVPGAEMPATSALMEDS